MSHLRSLEGPRILGVSVVDVSDRLDPVPSGKWSQFYSELARRFELIDVVNAEMSRRDHLLNLVRTFHPRRRDWRARAGYNETVFRKRTEAAQRGLAVHQDAYDLVVQLQTLCAPGFDLGGQPYVIYTDNTMALTERHYQQVLGASSDRAARWMRLEADVCRSASAVFTFSQFAAHSMVSDYGCSPERVAAVGAGANQLLSELGVKDYAVPRALFVGIDFARKGGPVLLRAWRIVREQVPDAELIIAGPKRSSRPDGHGVRWVGRVDRDALAALYRSASVFVLPSLFEPWGHVFFEAMGHGLPCVGSDCCAMPEIIEDGHTGRLVAPGEAEPLAAALIELLTDPSKASAMGKAAHAKVLSGNGWSDVVDRVAAHLGQTAESGPSREPSWTA